MGKEQREFFEDRDLHINYKNFKGLANMMQQNGIKTFGELAIYCKVWDIHSVKDLAIRLLQDVNCGGNR